MEGMATSMVRQWVARRDADVTLTRRDDAPIPGVPEADCYDGDRTMANGGLARAQAQLQLQPKPPRLMGSLPHHRRSQEQRRPPPQQMAHGNPRIGGISRVVASTPTCGPEKGGES